MTTPLDVLIIEDRENDALLMLLELRRAGYEPNYERVETLNDLRSALNRQPWQLVLSDYSLPQFSGRDSLRLVRTWDSDVPFIIVSGAIGEETAVATMKAGADDYILKGNLARLGPAVRRGLRDAEVRRAHRNAEEELRLQEALFRSLIENVADVVVILNEWGVVNYQSPSVERVLGYKPAESLGMRSLACLHPDELAMAKEILFSRINRQRQIPNLECRIRHKDGSWRILEGTVTNLLDDPATKGIVCNFRDTTERKYLERQLVQVQRMETIGNLAGGIAHDLNNLLTPVLIAADLLAGDLTAADREALVETLKSGANRAVDVVNQLLSLARGLRSGHDVAKVADVVRDTERLLRFGFPRSIHLDTKLPDALRPISIGATQLGQVLMNLCVNARDAMPDGGRLTIEARNLSVRETTDEEFRNAAAGDYVQLSVTDTGSGIPEEIQPRVFEPFFTTKPSGRGTGLGLWIVSRIVNDFGGFLNFDSGPSGTRFSVYLPAAPESPQPQKHEDLALSGELSIDGLVLVADGEAAIRQIIQETLETYGCDTVAAADGATALAIYRENPGKFGLAIIDVHLPVVDGSTTIAEIKAIDPQAPIVLQYRATADPDGLSDVKSQVNVVLEKPYTVEELLQSVREAVQNGHRELSGSVLVVADDSYAVNIIRSALRNMDIEVIAASTTEIGLRALTVHAPDLVLLDSDIPDRPASELLEQIRSSDRNIPVFVMADQKAQSLPEQARYQEANGFVQKPITIGRIQKLVTNAFARLPARPRRTD